MKKDVHTEHCYPHYVEAKREDGKDVFFTALLTEEEYNKVLDILESNQVIIDGGNTTPFYTYCGYGCGAEQDEEEMANGTKFEHKEGCMFNTIIQQFRK